MATLTVNTMRPSIGQTVLVRFESIAVKCTVTDAKSAYGRIRLEVRPVSGTGSQWVELDRIAGPVEDERPARMFRD